MNPAVIRAKDAPTYLGMDKNKFYREVKPYLTAHRMPGVKSRAIGYDRLELDAWWEQYKARGRSGKEDEWNENSPKALSGGKNPVEDITPPSTSKRCTVATTYVSLAKQVIQEKRKRN